MSKKDTGADLGEDKLLAAAEKTTGQRKNGDNGKMYISKIAVNNFRLLESVQLCLEKQTTVIVGRNNSGKTSLTELFRRLLGEGPPRFRLEDFSLGVHEKFWTAFRLKQNGAEDNAIRNALPVIKVEITVEYGDNGTNLGPLGEFIIDLAPNCTSAKAVMVQ